MSAKTYLDVNVYEASKERIRFIFDNFEKIYISFSGGKDSSVMMHMVMEEAIIRNITVGVLIIDLEAQYSATIKHIEEMIDIYKNNIDLHWICAELLLRNAVSDFMPKWCCWEEDKKNIWVRNKPKQNSDLSKYDFYVPKMEFEEFMVLFGKWYSKGDTTAAMIGIRADESLHRYRAIVSDKNGLTFKEKKFTTKIDSRLYNVYPIYDWKTEDIWIFHSKNKHLPYNKIYEMMSRAGVKLSNQRLCQP
jgi:predicted phosphoadenosine phosphosulfate sulfurtransferase